MTYKEQNEFFEEIIEASQVPVVIEFSGTYEECDIAVGGEEEEDHISTLSALIGMATCLNSVLKTLEVPIEDFLDMYELLFDDEENEDDDDEEDENSM